MHHIARWIYDLTLLAFCLLYMIRGGMIPLSEQLVTLAICATVAFIAWRWRANEVSATRDAVIRWGSAIAVVLIYWQARWVLMPEMLVPKREGIPCEVPWASIIVILRIVAFILMEPRGLIKLLGGNARPQRASSNDEYANCQSDGATDGDESSIESPTAPDAVEKHLRWAVIGAATLLTLYALIMYPMLKVRYPADMHIGWTVAVLSKAWEIATLLCTGSMRPTTCIRREFILSFLVLIVLGKLIWQICV